MGGIGKTELALQYAWKDREKSLKEQTYQLGICWIDVAEQGNVGTQILNFAQNYLKIPIEQEGELEDRVKICWQTWSEENKKALIIFDDVREYQQIRDFLPPLDQKSFKVMITTRQQNLARSLRNLALEILDKQSALDLIISFIGKERVSQELEEAELLCEDLGYLPLGLELVSRFLESRSSWSIKKYRERLKEKGLQTRGIEESSIKKSIEEMTAQRGVEKAFDITWDELEKETKEIAYYLSLFEVAPIPYQLIQELCPIEDEDDLEDILKDSLINSSLIKDLGNQVYEIHTLIHKYLREKLSESELSIVAKKAYCQLMVNISKEVPEQPIKTDIEALTLIIPHLTVVAKELNEWIEDDDLIIPYVGISRFYEGQSFYKEAEPWRKQCLDIVQKRLGEDHIDVALSLNDLGGLYHDQGRYSEAETLYRQALELRKKLLGEDHPDVATSIDNLAGLYLDQGRYLEAESLCLQALKLRKNLPGEDHFDAVATSLNNLAELYRVQGRYSEAETFYLQALELSNKPLRLGEDHLSVGQTLSNLAVLYRVQGRYLEAETLYRQALELRKKLLGEDHLSVAQTLSNLAVLYNVQGRYSEAEPLCIQALELFKKLLGENHPNVATSLNNLAGLYLDQGRYSEAETFYLQALELFKNLLGEDHPNTRTVKQSYEWLKQQMK